VTDISTRPPLPAKRDPRRQPPQAAMAYPADPPGICGLAVLSWSLELRPRASASPDSDNVWLCSITSAPRWLPPIAVRAKRAYHLSCTRW